MCSPELARGMCCICYGTLTPGNALYDDLHRGKCAILAGIYPDDETERICQELIAGAHRSKRGTYDYHHYMTRYYEFVDAIAKEDHYDMSGPV